MKISIITVCFNSKEFIKDTIESVFNQSYPEIEYIIVDGGSNDGTVDILKSYNGKIDQWVSEPDSGIYDAMNKGIRMATGDVVGIVNSDDFFHRRDSIAAVAKCFRENEVESVFADILFVKRDNPEKLIRYYSSKSFRPWKMKFGFMPAHPTFFTFKSTFEKYGYYDTSFSIAADFEIMVRFFLKHKLSFKYINMDLMKMRVGGVSTSSIKSTIIINKENLRALRKHGFYSNFLLLFSRYVIKIFHYLPFFIRFKLRDKISDAQPG